VGTTPGSERLTCLSAISEKQFATGHKKTITMWNVEGKHVDKISELQTNREPFKMSSLPNSRICWKNGKRMFFWNYSRGNSEPVSETKIPSHINHFANNPDAKKMVAGTASGRIYFVDYEHFHEQSDLWDLTRTKKNLFNVHIISEISWGIVFHSIIMFYDPQER
jgi:hypothetical protein